MGKGILITGGARSGKSSYAENLANGLGKDILYIATSIPFDEEMKQRVKKHKETRPAHWTTYEGYRDLGKEVSGTFDGVLLDCVTVMITNLMFDNEDMKNGDYDELDFDLIEIEIINEIKALMDAVKNSDTTVIFVTNEIGFGVVPETKLGRVFRDIAGRVNQYIASRCDEVYLTVCGIPMKIK